MVEHSSNYDPRRRLVVIGIGNASRFDLNKMNNNNAFNLPQDYYYFFLSILLLFCIPIILVASLSRPIFIFNRVIKFWWNADGAVSFKYIILEITFPQENVSYRKTWFNLSIQRMFLIIYSPSACKSISSELWAQKNMVLFCSMADVVHKNFLLFPHFLKLCFSFID